MGLQVTWKCPDTAFPEMGNSLQSKTNERKWKQMEECRNTFNPQQQERICQRTPFQGNTPQTLNTQITIF